jgi:sortase A
MRIALRHRLARQPGSRPGKSWRGRDAPTRGRRGLALVLAAIALALTLDAGWIHAKAALAQQLLHAAWQRSEDGDAHRPWPWADTHPVARLRVAAQGVDQIVLAGDAGRSLAFGPGWAEASAPPGGRGTVVISGHRDTHFSFLRELQDGEEVWLESTRALRRYRVASARVADTRHERIALQDGDDALLLVTCYPFDAIRAGGPLRFVVRAEAIDDCARDGRCASPVPAATTTQSSADAASSTPSPSA